MNLREKLLKDLKLLFLNLTQRIEPFFFLNATQKIEIFCLKNNQNIELFPKNYDSKNWIFSKNDAKSFFFQKKNLIRRMEPSWKYDFQTKTWLKELNPFWLGELIFLRLKELNFSSNMARRIELFLFSISQRMGVFSKNWIF